MNYESIAKLVHEYVKNSESPLALEKRLSNKELKTGELSIIQGVFSRYEVSGDTLMIGTTPMIGWL